ncbi:MAG: hypothetical protein O2780_05160 [Proteobacteria bacterium]|nr:hypothetical protein [Pseudomonadota bacterium]MDA1301566.1 hypothetical protein [Pseudomonadota bacterium]
MIKNLIIAGLLLGNGGLIYYLATRPVVPVPLVPFDAPAAPGEQIVPMLPSAPDDSDAVSKVIAAHMPGDSYADLADTLARLGVPEDTVKALLLAAIDRDTESTRMPYEVQTPYWKKPDRNRYEVVQAAIDAEEQKRRLILDLFGEAAVDDPLFADLFRPYDDSLPFLTSDKQIALDSLVRSTQAIQAELRSEGLLRETREEMRLVADDLDRSLRELLTSDEYHEYQLRESRTAEAMRHSMDGFDYGEQEFRDIFDIRNKLDFDAIREAGGGREAFAGARQTIDSEIRDYLGEARFEEYSRLQDPRYRSLQAIGERYGAADDEMIEVYEITRDMGERAQVISAGGGLSRQELRARIGQMQSEAHDQIVDLVGAEVAESVRQNINRSRRPGPGGSGGR